MRNCFYILFIFLFGCGPTSENKNEVFSADQKSNDSVSMRQDTAAVTGHIVHLKDTAKVEANCVVFLRPDEARFSDYEKDPGLQIYEADADFADGLTGTLNAFEKDKRYDDLNGEIVTERYVSIKGCEGGPLLIDRDSVDYGLILYVYKRDRKSTRLN